MSCRECGCKPRVETELTVQETEKLLKSVASELQKLDPPPEEIRLALASATEQAEHVK